MSNNNTVLLAVILSVVAVLISLGAIVLSINEPQPEEVDLTGIGNNRALITSLQTQSSDLKTGFDSLRDFVMNRDYGVDHDDLDDLEDDLRRYARNQAGEDGEDCDCDTSGLQNQINELYGLIDDLECEPAHS